MFRNTWMEVNLDKVGYNIRVLHELCGKRLIAVLKADGYGCGDSQIARTAQENGASMFAVSSLDEALMLRNEGFSLPILILGATDDADIEVMVEENISTAAYSPEWVAKAAAYGCKGLRVHLAVDTGMNRIGFRTDEELQEAFNTLSREGCIMEGIFTHFSCADCDLDFTNRQYERFAHAVKLLDYPFEWIHCDNSDATAFFKDPLSNACRVGISMYGISTYTDQLKAPISLYTTVIMVKHVQKGDKIGYGAAYEAQGDEIIATLPIGYADGFVRANSGRSIYIDGQYCPVVGRVCMDQVMVRLEKEVPVGTRAEIFGGHISLEKMAEELHTIPYEIICLISGRVTRKYRYHGLREEENARMIKSESKEKQNEKEQG